MVGGGLRLGLGGTLIVLVLSLVFRQNLFALLGDQGGAVPATLGPGEVGRGGAARGGRAGAREGRSGRVQRCPADLGRDPQDLPPGQAGPVLGRDALRVRRRGRPDGPFYCPTDERVYLDLGFYRELASRFGAPGQFAQAYVVAHEVGHHLQKLLGIESKVRAAQERDPARRNALSVRLELQADCFAGAWGRSASARHLLEPGDIDQGLAAAAAVGDDRIQKAATGRVSPESFTHGSAAQRSSWFRRGYEGGRLADCDTFSTLTP